MGKKNKNQKNKLGKMSQKDNVDNLEDVARWGSSKKNYYQEVDDQYASISQEEQEAQRIYHEQYQLLNDEHIYKLNDNNQNVQAQQKQQSDWSYQQQGGISQEFIKQQLQWALTFGQMCQILPLEDKYKQLYTKMINTYLLILISLKELKIPYITHHPILNDMSQLRIKLKVAQKRLQESMKNVQAEMKGSKEQSQQQKYEQQVNKQYEEPSDDNDQLNFEDQSQSNEQQQSSQQQQNFRNATQKGLYEKLKKQQEMQKRKRKVEKKQQFEQKKIKKQKPIFKQIEANQSRLLSQMIQKNKGLMKKRKRTDGNSRLKLRKKYQKAQKKLRARGHFVRNNPGRDYEGQTNIKYGKLSAVKLK